MAFTNRWVRSDFWSGLVADMGPYQLEDWPMAPPAWIPDDCEELDFYAALPHPSGNPALFDDGSYNTTVADAYRYRSGSHENVGSYTYADGPDSSPSTPDVRPAGAHLFLVWYGLDFPDPIDTANPSRSPLSLVPSTLFAGGTGAYLHPLGWSGWQAGPNLEHEAGFDYASDATYGYRAMTGIEDVLKHGPTPDGPPPYPPVDINTLGPLSAATARASIVDGFGRISTLSYKDGFGDSFPTRYIWDWQAITEAGEHWQGFRVDPAPTSPPPGLAALTEGTDWAANADSAPDGWELESTGDAPTVWTTGTAYPALDADPTNHSWGLGFDSFINYTGSGGITPPSSVDFSMVLRLYLAPPSTPASGALYDVSGGVEAASVDLALTVTPYPGLDGSVSGPTSIPLDLSVMGSAQQLVTVQVPKIMYEDGDNLWYDTAEIPPPGSFEGVFTGVTWTLGSELAFEAMKYLRQEPRWRYWRPPTLIIPPGGPSSIGDIEPYLRMSQRDDGAGVEGHPRLPAGQGSTSVQTSVAPRVGGNNTYA
jgi:hypothetical protein